MYSISTLFPLHFCSDNAAAFTSYFIFFIFTKYFRIQVTIVASIIISEMEVICEMQEKILLSIIEASHLFGIGQHRLREIIHEDYNCKYHLTVGRVIKIKRKAFEEYINSVSQI